MMKRRYEKECDGVIIAHNDAVSAGEADGVGCAADVPDTATTSRHSPPPAKRLKLQQKFCSIERLLRDEKKRGEGGAGAGAGTERMMMITMGRKSMTKEEDEDADEDGTGEEEGAEEEADELRTRNWLKAVSGPESGSAVDGLNCELENAETWTQFNKLGTEMIITKSGRRMFPVLRLRFSGTRPAHLYYVFMDVVPVERRHRFRYRYDKSQWQSAGKADKQPFGRLFMHNESPFSGEQLPLQLLSFDKAKLTNNEKSNPDPDQLLLNSMHKYRPRIHVLCVPPSDHSAAAQPPNFPKQFRRTADFDKFSRFAYKTFEFPETKFVAVTAYQNQLVTRKKIELNPFAKGFRDQKGGEDDESGDNFSPDGTMAREWTPKRDGAEKGDERNAPVPFRRPTVLLKPYRIPTPPPPPAPCQPTPIRPVPPLPFALPFWPLLPPHLLSGLLFRIGANQQQRQMIREQAKDGERQTEKGLNDDE
uniref:T-box domain-containing protein n=1 Tax=Globodera rostochiensis TaxID=31243 RepID=A0A914H3M5_GLORO